MIEVLEVVPAHPSVIFSFVSSHIWLQTAFGMQQNVVFPHFRLQTYFFLLLSKLKTCNTPFPIASKATEASTPTTVQSTCVPMGTSAQMAREPRRWRAAAVQPSYTGHHETLLEKKPHAQMHILLAICYGNQLVPWCQGTTPNLYTEALCSSHDKTDFLFSLQFLLLP